MAGKSFTKEEILTAIKRVGAELGRAPSRSEFSAKTKIDRGHVVEHFKGWRDAVKEAGYEPYTSNMRIDDALLSKDYGQLLDKYKRPPTVFEYGREGKYSTDVFATRFGGWRGVLEKFRIFAANKAEWNDVLAMLPSKPLLKSVETEAESKSESRAQFNASARLSGSPPVITNKGLPNSRI